MGFSVIFIFALIPCPTSICDQNLWCKPSRKMRFPSGWASDTNPKVQSSHYFQIGHSRHNMGVDLKWYEIIKYAMIFFLNTLLLLHSIDDNFEMEGCKSCRFSQLLATVILAQKIVVSLGLAMTNLAFLRPAFLSFFSFSETRKMVSLPELLSSGRSKREL